MTHDELQKIINQGIKEAHALGLQSGKQETSNLVADIKKEITKIAQEQIEHKELIVNYIKKDTTDKDEMKEWQENATPAINILKKLMSFGSVGGWLLQSLILLGAGVGVIYALVKWLKN